MITGKEPNAQVKNTRLPVHGPEVLKNTLKTTRRITTVYHPNSKHNVILIIKEKRENWSIKATAIINSMEGLINCEFIVGNLTMHLHCKKLIRLLEPRTI